jgi:hypothetical protein
VGQSIIGNSPFQVIGVMSEKGALRRPDDDDMVLMPYPRPGPGLRPARADYTVMAVADVGRIHDTQQRPQPCCWRGTASATSASAMPPPRSQPKPARATA